MQPFFRLSDCVHEAYEDDDSISKWKPQHGTCCCPTNYSFDCSSAVFLLLSSWKRTANCHLHTLLSFWGHTISVIMRSWWTTTSTHPVMPDKSFSLTLKAVLHPSPHHSPHSRISSRSTILCRRGTSSLLVLEEIYSSLLASLQVFPGLSQLWQTQDKKELQMRMDTLELRWNGPDVLSWR